MRVVLRSAGCGRLLNDAWVGEVHFFARRRKVMGVP